jgi:hypothetical protein
MNPVPIPWDCIDGFILAYWRRPAAYLQEPVRRGSSLWARVGPTVEKRVVRDLAADLESGEWYLKNAYLLDRDEADLGARVLLAQ